MTTPSDPNGPGNYPPPAPGGGYGAPPQQQTNTPMILSIIGVVCWFLCSPAAIVLGLIGESKAKAAGQSSTFPRVVWIVGIVFLLIAIIYRVTR